MKKILLLALAALLAWLLFWPVPIDPVAWQAPEAPKLEDAYARNDALKDVTWLGKDQGIGPEDVAIDAEGNLYVGYVDGRIVRFNPQGEQPAELANTGGRPLGLDFDPDGNLVIADGYKGLLRMTPDGKLETLSTEADGVAFGFTDDVDVASDGMMYFSDASSKFGPAMKARDDVLEHGGHGRLLKYDPVAKTTSVLLDGLQFANGVALCPDERCVLVAQTGSYNVVRVWLQGEKAGQHDIFIDNLPGLPDGISSNGTDTLWIALFAPRNALLDALSPYPFLRKLAFRLPHWLQPQPAAHGFVLGVSFDGEVTHNFQHEGAQSFHPITSAEQFGNTLYLGSLEQPAFAALTLATSNAEQKEEAQ